MCQESPTVPVNHVSVYVVDYVFLTPDLRQDMLTLQIIGIMDSIWHMEGLDLKLVHGCCIVASKLLSEMHTSFA